MRQKIKFLDPLTITSITLMIAFIPGFMAIKTGNKNYAFLTLFLVFIFVLLFLWARSQPGLLLENDYTGKVRFKPEDGCEPQELTRVPQAVDGINTGIKPGKVFKVRSGTNVYIDARGNVRSYSPISAWVNKWVSKNEFKPAELQCWEKLF